MDEGLWDEIIELGIRTWKRTQTEIESTDQDHGTSLQIQIH